jgi:hypothetical protein
MPVGGGKCSLAASIKLVNLARQIAETGDLPQAPDRRPQSGRFMAQAR